MKKDLIILIIFAIVTGFGLALSISSIKTGILIGIIVSALMCLQYFFKILDAFHELEDS